MSDFTPSFGLDLTDDLAFDPFLGIFSQEELGRLSPGPSLSRNASAASLPRSVGGRVDATDMAPALQGRLSVSKDDSSNKRARPQDHADSFVWKRCPSTGSMLKGDDASDDDEQSLASVASIPNFDDVGSVDPAGELDEAAKKELRLARNRESARLRRLRKRNRIDLLGAKVKDIQTKLDVMESFVWGQPTAVLSDIATFDVNRDSLPMWSGSPSHADFSTFLQAKIRWSASLLVRYSQQLLAAQRDNHALVTLANAKLTGTTDPVLLEGLSVIGLSEEQAREINLNAAAVTNAAREVQAAVADITNMLQAGVANMVAPQADVSFSRRNSSRASLSSLDQSSASFRNPTAENIAFSSVVVDAVIKKVQKSGLLPDQLSGLYTFCCDNAGVIARLSIPVVPSNAAVPPVPTTMSRVRSRGDIAMPGLTKSPSGHSMNPPPLPGSGMSVGRISRPGSTSAGMSPHQTALPSPFGIFGTPGVLPSPLPGLQLSPRMTSSLTAPANAVNALFGASTGDVDPFSRSALSAMLSGFAMHDSDEDLHRSTE